MKNVDWIKSELTNKYLTGTRSVSNFSYADHTRLLKMSDNDFRLKNLSKYSCKYTKIIKHIRNTTGTIFIYSNFRKTGGLQSFARALLMNGYQNYAENGIGPNRFAIWSAKESTSYRDLIRSLFNSKSNTNGSEIKIILGSPSIREGCFVVKNIGNSYIRTILEYESYISSNRSRCTILFSCRFGRKKAYC